MTGVPSLNASRMTSDNNSKQTDGTMTATALR
jgi:hypothetical protein